MTPAQHGYAQCARCRTWQKPDALEHGQCRNGKFCDVAAVERAQRGGDEVRYKPETQGLDIWGEP